MRVLLTVLLNLFVFTAYAGDYVFDYNSRCHKAYTAYMALDMETGRRLIIEELKENPYNLMATYIADYEDCLQLLMNGDKALYEQLKGRQGQRLDLLERGSTSSPWQRICRAGIYLHWAMVHMRMGENLKAATSFRKSYLLAKENNSNHSSFAYNNIYLGMEEAIVGTIPDDYKWLASVFGLKGNVKKGAARLAGFINSHDADDALWAEAVIYNSYLRFYLLHSQQDVWNFLNSSGFDVNNNLMNSFVKANIALNYRKADEAIAMLNQMRHNSDYSKFPIFEYELGNALLHKQDYDASISHYSRFLKSYKGSTYVKDAWQSMAYAYYLQGAINKANYCLQQIRKQGSTQVDADKQALRFAESGNWPNVTLLKARLLIDGGYYRQALALLAADNEGQYSNLADKLEYSFRLGRAHDELGSDNKALYYYQSTINKGRNSKEYFAARAALQMGFIYEKAGKYKEAIARFKECLSMKGHDFQNSIDQQAKAGLNRLQAR